MSEKCNLLPEAGDPETSGQILIQPHESREAVQMILTVPGKPIGRGLDVTPEQAKIMARALWDAAVEVERRQPPRFNGSMQ